jgi:hypothetical protein
MGMTGKRLFAVAALACGCSSSSPPPPPGPLDPAFAGTWNGKLTVSLGTLGSVLPIQSPFVVAITSSSTATSGNCVGGVQHYVGSGDTMSTSDEVTCPSQPLSIGTWSCGSVLITYTKGTATLANNTVTVVDTGTAVACGSTYTATLTFVGVQGLGGGPGFAGQWQTYANGWNVDGAAAGWAGTSWNPGQGTTITSVTSGNGTVFTQTDASKTFWHNTLQLETEDDVVGTITTPTLEFNMGTSFALGGFGYNCGIQTTQWNWDPVRVSFVYTTCGLQDWLVISGSGNFSVTDIGENCSAPTVGYSTAGQLSWFLSNGAIPCGETWVQTWATAGEEPYDYGPWYSENVDLTVEWSEGAHQDEGKMAQDPTGPVGLVTVGVDNVLYIQGVSVSIEPTTLYDATPDGLGDDNPNWGTNVAAKPPPAESGIQCASAVTFIPQTVSAITRTVEPGFYGSLSFTRAGYLTGCSNCSSGTCVPQNVNATETWGP